MHLRLPDSGSLIQALFSPSGDAAQPPSADVVDDVTPEQLAAAIAAMVRGDIEYLGLEHGAGFLQAAGEGEGPYEVQVTRDGDIFHDVAGGADKDTMTRIVTAYLRRDPSWRDAPWAPPLDW
ncbi:MAG TPA: hypothetical protein VMF13_19555 [Luteitalea sp.]|nr:hypothetical protein [Luteitalea sp.]